MPVDSEGKHYVLVNGKRFGLGHIPDEPDERDYLFRPPPETIAMLSSSVDLTSFASTPTLDQYIYNDCTANAAIGIFMWLQQAVMPPAFLGSVLAEYKWGRNLDGLTGDSGLSPRTAMRVMYQTGVMHDSLWPMWLTVTYEDTGPGIAPNTNWDSEPTAAMVADASNNKATNYWRCDDSNYNIDNTINNMRAAIGTSLVVNGVTIPGVPVMFSTLVGGAFSIFSGNMDISVPTEEEFTGGHAIIAIGYNDTRVCSDSSYGAFLIKNSWGDIYGNGGYAWMPYNYLRVVSSKSPEYCDAWAIGLESEIIGKTPIQIPSWAKKFPSMSEIDITNYLTLRHDLQPTPGQHSVEIVPVDGTAHVNAHVRVREKQPRRE